MTDNLNMVQVKLTTLCKFPMALIVETETQQYVVRYSTFVYRRQRHVRRATTDSR